MDRKKKSGLQHPRRELRFAPAEVRAKDGEPPKITGYAAVFDSPSEPLGTFFGPGFVERIRQGAFTKTLREQPDIKALWNHNPDFVLGSTRARTLALEEDDRGLHIEITPPDSELARSFVASVQRGDAPGMSFMFEVVKDEITRGENGQPDERTLLEVRLHEISAGVAFPAYPAAEASVRSKLLVDAGLSLDDLAALDRALRGHTLTSEDHDAIRRVIDQFRSYLPDEPGQAAHSAGPNGKRTGGEPAQAGDSLLRLRRLRKRIDLTVHT